MASRCPDFDEQMSGCWWADVSLKSDEQKSDEQVLHNLFKILDWTFFWKYLFPHRPQKNQIERLFKILDLIYLFPCSPKGNGKLKGFHLNGDKMSFQNTLPILSFSTQATKEWKIGFHLNGDKVSFQKTWTCLFISTQATEEWKIERISPEWGPSVFSKYLTLFSYFHTG